MPKTRGGRTARIIAACGIRTLNSRDYNIESEQNYDGIKVNSGHADEIISTMLSIPSDDSKSQDSQKTYVCPISDETKALEVDGGPTLTKGHDAVELSLMDIATVILQSGNASPEVLESPIMSSSIVEPNGTTGIVDINESSSGRNLIIIDSIGYAASAEENIEPSEPVSENYCLNVVEATVQDDIFYEQKTNTLHINTSTSVVEMTNFGDQNMLTNEVVYGTTDISNKDIHQKDKMSSHGDMSIVEDTPLDEDMPIDDESIDGDMLIDDEGDKENSDNINLYHEVTDGDQNKNKKSGDKPFSAKKVATRKKNRNLGQKYTTSKGVIKEARVMKPLRMNCRSKCRDRLNENMKQDIFREYWSLGTHDRRVAFIASLINAKETSITRNKVEGRAVKNRLYSFTYMFLINGEKINVCKICFLNTLGETEKFVTCSVNNKLTSNSGITHTDKRGTNTPIHKTSRAKIDEVKMHISSFPAYESHYSRRHTDKKYLASDLNLTKMYNLYLDTCKGKPVSIKIYSREFNNLGLKFKKPKNDTCSKCDTLVAQQKYSNDEEDKLKLRKELEEHISSADLAYLAKDQDKTKGIEDAPYITYTFDLQQVLQTPHLSTNKMFYLRQLATYNLTIHNCISGESSHFMWPECTAGRGANEVASCLKRFIMDIPSDVKHIVFYSDTCGGQNKNSIVSSMLQYIIHQHPSLEIIDHKFLVPGHTHMECDVDHAVIEKAKKKCSFDIHVPRDWYQLVRTASKKRKFNVFVMDQEHFISFSELTQKGPLQNSKNKEFKWRSVCWLRYDKSTAVKYKFSLNEDDEFKEISFFRKSQKLGILQNFKLKPLYKSPRPISKKKKDNLIEISKMLDKEVQNYYMNLQIDADLNKDTDPDIDRYFSDEEN